MSKELNEPVDEERHSNPEETLEYIRIFMIQSRQAFSENGFYYIYWGAAVPLWTGLSYLLGTLGQPRMIGPAWLFLYIISLTLFFFRERRRDHNVKTFEERILGSVWVAVAFAFVSILTMLLIRKQVELSLALSLVAAVLGIAYWIVGGLMKNFRVKLLALGWWAACPLLALVPENYSPAVMAAATVLLDLIPGLIFYFRSRRES